MPSESGGDHEMGAPTPSRNPEQRRPALGSKSPVGVNYLVSVVTAVLMSHVGGLAIGCP